jgi:hypothetical protein
MRWNFRGYRLRFTLQLLSCKVCPPELSQLKGSVQPL